jgi:hypothetical protein
MLRDTCHEVLRALGFSYHLSSAFLFAPSHVQSTWCDKSFPNTLPIHGRRVRKPSLCDMPLCKNLRHMCLISNMCKATICHLCYIPRLRQFCKNLCHLCYIPSYVNFCKNLCHLCYIPSYFNFAKTYVICLISQAMSILQKPMSLVLYPKLCQFCKNLCHLCYIPRLSQFCKNLCHSVYYPKLCQFCKTL